MEARELLYLGLSEKEAKVYLATLELGKSSVQKIAEKADVNRATTYVIIEGLMKKGLMSSITENKKQFFFAEAPEKLSLLFREQAMEIQRKQEYLDKIIPELKTLKTSGSDKPAVRYFEGKEGVLAVNEEFFLIKHEDIARMIYPSDLVNKFFSENDTKRVRDRRFKQKIHNKVIYSKQNGKLSDDEFSERKQVPFADFPIEADIAIFGNIVRMATIKNKLSGIIIENEEIAKTLKTLFDLAWKGIEKRGS